MKKNQIIMTDTAKSDLRESATAGSSISIRGTSRGVWQFEFLSRPLCVFREKVV